MLIVTCYPAARARAPPDVPTMPTRCALIPCTDPCTDPCTGRTNAPASRSRRRGTRLLRLLGITGLALLTAAGTAIVGDLTLGSTTHLDQNTLLALVQQGRPADAFTLAFDHGNELFDTRFTAQDGGGANVGRGQRYTRTPRADLFGRGEWATHVPARTTGPNAESCTSCHNQPADDGAGGIASNVHRDPFHTGSVHLMIQRNTPHTFGGGALQRLAEEMTADLQAIKEQLAAQVRQTWRPASAALTSKGVAFGTLRAYLPFFSTRVAFDYSRVDGVDSDLVVKPFQWKGSVAFLRDFSRGAAHNELGMQAVELVGDGVDGDGDGVVDELSVGDVTAFAIYLAAQPRPVTKIELSSLGLIPTLDPAEVAAIGRGSAVFAQIGCTSCHVPSLDLLDVVFREPSAYASHRDARFPGGQQPVAVGVRPDLPVSFDLTQDQPENVIVVNGQTVHLGTLRPRAGGQGAVVELYGDLKRHRMGPGLAESIDETGTGASTFMTENLWGVGSTAPYLHDGRATTLAEAILAHGGEAANERAAFIALPAGAQADLIAFLDNLVLYKVE